MLRYIDVFLDAGKCDILAIVSRLVTKELNFKYIL